MMALMLYRLVGEWLDIAGLATKKHSFGAANALNPVETPEEIEYSFEERRAGFVSSQHTHKISHTTKPKPLVNLNECVLGLSDIS
ncbi:hypothetical protein NC651_029403 [Populus alba x Populus x berolinensis]|nr:hypothetical protein NC651_029403 [Populus alba x Populus x berolinensis]